MNSVQQVLWVFVLLLIAGALLLVGWSLLAQGRRLAENELVVDRIIAAQHDDKDAKPVLSWQDRLVDLFKGLIDTPLGRIFVAEEDRHLLDQSGLNDNRGRVLFFILRAGLSVGLPLLAFLLLSKSNDVSVVILSAFFGLALGYMLPKWVMQSIATQRKERAAEELPLLIDLLRLLQGVGLSVDQSLHVIEHEFIEVLPVLGGELVLASQQYRVGRTREQSLKRLATVFDHADLQSLTQLIVQVERHGGAVQEPLRVFSERIREQRKLDMKALIGRLTVKMTGVMVLTLLPGLLIITGGVGFLAVIRALSKMTGTS
ncbi:MAG: type II secretion system F family protein [Sulfuriferula sp.]|nr:type II secretion system F family protein [Sulfuriferula sp.]